MFITSIKFVQTIRAQVISLHRTNEKYQYQTLLLNAYPPKKRQKENWKNKKEIMIYKSLNYKLKLDPFLIILNTMQNSR